MITIHPKAEELFLQEECFKLFKHCGLLCCVQRINYGGHINGYVGVQPTCLLYEKEYSAYVSVSKVEDIAFNGNYMGLLLAANSPETEAGLLRLDMALNVHGGLTYSDKQLNGIEDELFGPLWWFGFDTAHSGDVRVYKTDLDRKYPQHGYEYRDLTYVIEQTKSLAEQLSKF